MKVYHGKSNRNTARDYNRKRYGNPMFRTTRQRRERVVDWSVVKLYATLLLAAAAGTAALWYLFWSPAFRITEFSVKGASADTEAAIRSILDKQTNGRRFLVFSQASVLVFDSKAAEEGIRASFFLSKLKISKKLPKSLVVDVEEKQVAAGFVSGNRFLSLDDEGFVVREMTTREIGNLGDLPAGLGAVATGELGAESVDLAEMSGSTDVAAPDISGNSNPLPLILDRADAKGEYKPGERAVQPEVVTMVLQGYEKLPGLLGSGVRWFALESAADTVDVAMREGWNLYLTTTIPFDTQGQRLVLVLKEKIGDKRGDLEYVDLRYDERIFFRLKEAAGETTP